jgi:alkanesulfonate monooxygenase SsuD/methylene tetrahydromethanopterin reductase-like flavin-dependent oxidoreductase (luciferase family)
VAANPKGLGRVVAQGDGWFPLMNAENENEVYDSIPVLRERLQKAGRDADSVEVSVYMCPQDEGVVERCREHGVARVIFLLQPEPREKALPEVDRLAELARRVGA